MTEQNDMNIQTVPQQHSGRGSLITIVILIVLLVAAGVGLSLLWIQNNENASAAMTYQKESQSCKSDLTTCTNALDLVPEDVFFYTMYPDAPGQKAEVHVVHNDTGEDETLAEGYELYAVPQRSYDGKIYAIEEAGEGDNPSRRLYEIDVVSGEVNEVVFSQDLPFVFEATALSPDQTKLVAAYDNTLDHDGAETAPTRELVVWNLLDGTSAVLTTLEDGQYFSEYNGPNAFAGANGYLFKWVDLDCVRTYIYGDNDEDPESSTKKYLRTEQFCPAE